MELLTVAGERFGGADALVEVSRRIWWARPLCALARLPGAMRFLRVLYAWVAARRRCLGGTCAVPKAGRSLDWLPLVVCPAVVLGFHGRLVPWAFMWALAFSIYTGCKWLTWRKALRGGSKANLSLSLGYLLAWPGMDATAFLRDSPEGVQSIDTLKPAAGAWPSRRLWGFAAAKTLFGVALIWGVVPRVMGQAPLLAGWIGLAGLGFVLHFGLFHLLALTWQRVGVNAQPIMRAPLLGASLAELWGRRWNLAFHLLVHDFAFRPMRRRLGHGAATLAVFVLSGLIHELVISLPAGAGYGWPTAYFFAQGLGVWIQQSRAGLWLRLGGGVTGWLFMFAFAVGPAFWLFHPPFLHLVFLPFLNAIKAI